jgi:23S rRNA (cytosine1962-C5)-methyltransferase
VISSSFAPIVPSQWPGYELLDFGHEHRLERWGTRLLVRPDKDAFGFPSLTQEEWKAADVAFDDRGKGTWLWRGNEKRSEVWNIAFESMVFELRLTPFKHVGLFPEQLSQWLWLRELIAREQPRRTSPLRVLNLFAYTGAATLFAASAGAQVVHIESSRSTITWARRNQELSGLSSAKIRWIPEDAATFVQRELERGNQYDIILLDPPVYGLGPKGQRWQFAKHIKPLLENCKDLLSDDALALVLNAYASEWSPRTWSLHFANLMDGKNGSVRVDALGIQATHRNQDLTTGLSVGWFADEHE